jgi:hypothetical protein
MVFVSQQGSAKRITLAWLSEYDQSAIEAQTARSVTRLLRLSDHGIVTRRLCPMGVLLITSTVSFAFSDRARRLIRA